METVWEQFTDKLIGLLPKGQEKEILEGGIEALKPYLQGTSSEILLAPHNNRALASIMSLAITKI